MSYIKTKNGIYKVSHFNDWATHKRKGATLLEGYKTSYIKNENIIAQSENLEELCDEFVIDETHYMENDLKEMVLYRDCIAGGLKTTIYGAVWTNKGLIYVAKMDSEGKLVLI